MWNSLFLFVNLRSIHVIFKRINHIFLIFNCQSWSKSSIPIQIKLSFYFIYANIQLIENWYPNFVVGHALAITNRKWLGEGWTRAGQILPDRESRISNKSQDPRVASLNWKSHKSPCIVTLLCINSSRSYSSTPRLLLLQKTLNLSPS